MRVEAQAMTIGVKRVYAPPAAADGLRILVDRLWPRGLAHERARVDRWMKELAPSDALRRWFGHDPAKWAEFKRRYFRELAAQPEAVAALAALARRRRITLLYAAADERHNNAITLKAYLERKTRTPSARKPPRHRTRSR
jgi:uncharacterized protein YeaO (DUF488 family)